MASPEPTRKKTQVDVTNVEGASVVVVAAVVGVISIVSSVGFNVEAVAAVATIVAWKVIPTIGSVGC